GDGVEHHHVEIVRVELFAKALNVGAHVGGGGGARFGHDGNLLARDVLERLGAVRVRAVLVGGIPKRDAVVKAVAVQIHNPADAQLASLVRRAERAGGTGAHGQPR